MEKAVPDNIYLALGFNELRHIQNVTIDVID
jgi:hypothetical protein